MKRKDRDGFALATTSLYRDCFSLHFELNLSNIVDNRNRCLQLPITLMYRLRTVKKLDLAVLTTSRTHMLVGARSGPTHEHARSHGARRSSMQHLLRRAVRPVRGTGQTGRRAQRRRSDEHSPGRDPVGASAYRVALGLVGQLERPQTPWRREKNSMSRLEK